MSFGKLKDHFNNTFNTTAKKVAVCCVAGAVVAACVIGGLATGPSDHSDQNKEIAVETKKKESLSESSAIPGASADADLLKAEKAVSEAQTAYNTAKTAYNKDKTSASAKQEASEKGNALLSAKKKLLSLTTDSDDKEKLQNDISTLSTEIGTYKDVAKATPEATTKSDSKPEAKKETSRKKDTTSKSGQGTTPKKETVSNMPKKSNGSGNNSVAAGGTTKNNNPGNTKKACKTVHHPAQTHTVNHPAVTHQEPVYTTRQVQTGTRTVVDQQAYDETVYVGDIITCNNCGAKFNNYEAYKTHAIEVEGGTGGYHVDPNYQTVHHDAVTHQEPVYTTQQVQTGTRTVTDKQAWTETVTDKAAYTTCE